LVIVLRGSPNSSHRRGRRPRLIYLGRAVRVDVFFKVFKLDPQKCSPLDKASTNRSLSSGIEDKISRSLFSSASIRFSLVICFFLATFPPPIPGTERGVARARPSSKLE